MGRAHWPLESAAEIALGAVIEMLDAEPPITMVRFVLHGRHAYRAFVAAGARRGLAVEGP